MMKGWNPPLFSRLGIDEGRQLTDLLTIGMELADLQHSSRAQGATGLGKDGLEVWDVLQDEGTCDKLKGAAMDGPGLGNVMLDKGNRCGDSLLSPRQHPELAPGS